MSVSYCVGIDLGTTNSVVSYIPADPPSADQDGVMPTIFAVPQAVRAGEFESLPHLPSFLYLPREAEADAMRVPGIASDRPPSPGVAGTLARDQAAENPQRVVVGAKSWLCLGRVGRTEAVLPWQSPPEVPKVSALDATRHYLWQIASAWNDANPDSPLRQQNVTLTVPASFDPAARELTRRAAVEAGLPEDFTLLEEPQAAVYRWLSAVGDRWRKILKAGDVMLVVDVGGGTCDLTLVTVADVDGEVQLQRLAVGNHLLVGGDNMDLALAHFVATRLAAQGHDLDPWQSYALWHTCRRAKERLLGGGAGDAVVDPESDPGDVETISVMGRGSSLIGGMISTSLTGEETRRVILDGFFPKCSAADRPARNAASGFQDIGLPFEQDPAITKHVAAFLADQSNAGLGVTAGQAGVLRPTHVLLNGGVFRSPALRERLLDVIASWCDVPPVVLGGPQDLDTSVAIGAAHYGWCKLNGGIRIRGGTARSYYIGIETAGLAIPGVPRPLRALCVAARGMEEGTQVDVPGQQVAVVVGVPARFRFFSAVNRPEDQVGTQLDRWSADELIESETIELSLTAKNAGDDPYVPVRFISRVTELGMFELWCHSTTGEDAWKLEFNVREDSSPA